MSKYKAGDKVVLTVTGTEEAVCHPYYVLNDNNFNILVSSIDKYAEPLSTYTEPLEAKIKRQAAEITRLLAENKKLKEALEAASRTSLHGGRIAGQNEAWELVRKIFDMETNDIEDIFIKEDAWNLGTVLNNYTYQEAAAKVAEWERAKEEVKVGDEVEKNDLRDVRFIVTFTNGRLMNGVTQSGLVFANEKPKEWHKTGRHIDIDSFLKQIGEE